MSKTEIITPAIFFGGRRTGKTTRIMEAVKELLAENPNFSYTFLGGAGEYSVDGYDPQPVKVNSWGNAFEIETEADIIILMETSAIDFAFMNHLRNMGKHVFVELHSETLEKAYYRLNLHKEFYQEGIDRYKFNLMVTVYDSIRINFGAFDHFPLEQVQKDFEPEILLDTAIDLTLNECTSKGIIMTEFPVITPNVFFGNRSTGKTSRIMEAVQDLLQAQPDSSYAVIDADNNTAYDLTAEGYSPQPVKLKFLEAACEVTTDADIVVISAQNSLDFAFIHHLMRAGKYVFIEFHEYDLDTVIKNLKSWKEAHTYDLDFPHMVESFLIPLHERTYRDSIPVEYDDTIKGSLAKELPNPETFHYYECTDSSYNARPMFFKI